MKYKGVKTPAATFLKPGKLLSALWAPQSARLPPGARKHRRCGFFALV
jgi:hypothetical protein